MQFSAVAVLFLLFLSDSLISSAADVSGQDRPIEVSLLQNLSVPASSRKTLSGLRPGHPVKVVISTDGSVHDQPKFSVNQTIEIKRLPKSPSRKLYEFCGCEPHPWSSCQCIGRLLKLDPAFLGGNGIRFRSSHCSNYKRAGCWFAEDWHPQIEPCQHCTQDFLNVELLRAGEGCRILHEQRFHNMSGWEIYPPIYNLLNNDCDIKRLDDYHKNNVAIEMSANSKILWNSLVNNGHLAFGNLKLTGNAKSEKPTGTKQPVKLGKMQDDVLYIILQKIKALGIDSDLYTLIEMYLKYITQIQLRENRWVQINSILLQAKESVNDLSSKSLLKSTKIAESAFTLIYSQLTSMKRKYGLERKRSIDKRRFLQSGERSLRSGERSLQSADGPALHLTKRNTTSDIVERLNQFGLSASSLQLFDTYLTTRDKEINGQKTVRSSLSTAIGHGEDLSAMLAADHLEFLDSFDNDDIKETIDEFVKFIDNTILSEQYGKTSTPQVRKKRVSVNEGEYELRKEENQKGGEEERREEKLNEEKKEIRRKKALDDDKQLTIKEVVATLRGSGVNSQLVNAMTNYLNSTVAKADGGTGDTGSPEKPEIHVEDLIRLRQEMFELNETKITLVMAELAAFEAKIDSIINLLKDAEKLMNMEFELSKRSSIDQKSVSALKRALSSGPLSKTILSEMKRLVRKRALPVGDHTLDRFLELENSVTLFALFEKFAGFHNQKVKNDAEATRLMKTLLTKVSSLFYPLIDIGMVPSVIENIIVEMNKGINIFEDANKFGSQTHKDEILDVREVKESQESQKPARSQPLSFSQRRKRANENNRMKPASPSNFRNIDKRQINRDLADDNGSYFETGEDERGGSGGWKNFLYYESDYNEDGSNQASETKPSPKSNIESSGNSTETATTSKQELTQHQQEDAEKVNKTGEDERGGSGGWKNFLYYESDYNEDGSNQASEAKPSPKKQRKEYRQLTPSERDAFNKAFRGIMTTGISEKQNLIDMFIEHHTTGENLGTAHSNQLFLPWHREYLHLVEQALQSIDSTVSLPYWDTTLDRDLDHWNESIMFLDETLGRSDEHGKVVSGPSGNVQINTGHCDFQYVYRFFYNNPSRLMSNREVDFILRARTLREMEQPNKNEQWQVVPRPVAAISGYHGNVHTLFDERSNDPISAMSHITCAPADVIFFLLHCFVDQLWERVRQSNPNRYSDFPSFSEKVPNELYIVRPFNVTIKDIIGDKYEQLFTYSQAPSAIRCQVATDCGGEGEMLYCSADNKCRAKLRVGSKCAANEQCYASRCFKTRCTQ